MIEQSEQSAFTLFVNKGRSSASYRAVFVSGRSRAILPPPPLPPLLPLLLLLLLPHAASAAPSTSTATAASSALTPVLRNMSLLLVDSCVTPAPPRPQRPCSRARGAARAAPLQARP